MRNKNPVDGHAIKWTSEYKEWYLNGKELSEKLFFKLTGINPDCSG